MRVQDLIDYLDKLAPPVLAEEWDNVGLLVGSGDELVERVMTCLTVTAETVAEAIERNVQLIVTHHPLPFRPIKKITTGTTPGRLLWDLMRHGISVASYHTAYDSTLQGLNQLWADQLQLQDIQPLRDVTLPPVWAVGQPVGIGRSGLLPQPLPLASLARQVCQFLQIAQCQVVLGAAEPVQRVGIACGSAGELISAAASGGCQVFITGEATFHTCLEAQAQGLALLLVGHYPSERWGMLRLADQIRVEFPEIEVWGSVHERDPLIWIGAQ